MPSSTYPDFKSAWLEEITAGTPSTVELGNRFSRKLLVQWLELDDEIADIVFCDGAGDGGIDAAYLDRHDPDENQGDTWYLVQSKYGSAFAGVDTLLKEGLKVLDTLGGHRTALSSLAADVLQRLQNFRQQAGDKDKLILVFATVDPLTNDEKRTLNQLRVLGRSQLGDIFDVEAVSLRTLYEQAEEADGELVVVPLTASLAATTDDLLVGTLTLTDLYAFLKAYRQQTGDLDRIYDKNVRRFLGSRRKVNKGIIQTLEADPEKFGLYNNGITLVVSEFERQQDGSLNLMNPYIVNGCQTTRSIWEVCQARIDPGGTGSSAALAAWRARAATGVVVTKIVRVGDNGAELLGNITRYTNSQNAVSDKDFLTLQRDFHEWERAFTERYGIFLEVQRGGWDSRRAYQKRTPNATQFTRYANAFALLKVYGAGWLREAGLAFNKNAPFLPNGAVYGRMTDPDALGHVFDVDDLYAAYLLHQSADDFGFGRGAKSPSRRQTRFLFFLVVLDLLRAVLRTSGTEPSHLELTRALLRLHAQPAAYTTLMENALNLIEEYLNPGMESSAFQEQLFRQDLNGFLKSEQLGKHDATPMFHQLLTDYQRVMARGGPSSPRQIILSALAT
jgi:hypothetical protein